MLHQARRVSLSQHTPCLPLDAGGVRNLGLEQPCVLPTGGMPSTGRFSARCKEHGSKDPLETVQWGAFRGRFTALLVHPHSPPVQPCGLHSELELSHLQCRLPLTQLVVLLSGWPCICHSPRSVLARGLGAKLLQL